MGHWWSMVTHVLPIVAAPLLVSPSRVAVALLLLHTALRLVLNQLICARLGIATSPPWFILLRETACLAIWVLSYVNRRIEWRGANFVVTPGGGIRTEAAPNAAESTLAPAINKAPS
jgi:hypothetical protein